jgi:hypothetical protein
MKTLLGTLATLALALVFGAGTAFAQLANHTPVAEDDGALVAVADSTAEDAEAEAEAEGRILTRVEEAYEVLFLQEPRLQFFTPYDQRGLNVFETPKIDNTPFRGFTIRWGGAFAQQMQGLSHENAPRIVDGKNVNELEEIGVGFNTASANLYLDAQLFDGVRVHLATYLSSKHHPEAWVKGGYLQMDRLPIDVPALDKVFDYLSIRAGHFGINYGDAHFRRSDNAQALRNPFVENYILDAFTTEIGMEFTAQYNGLLGVLGITGGELQGNVRRPDDRAPSFYGKLGVDRQLNDDLRVRLTGSAYTTAKSVSNSLYWGDRSGSRYHSVLTGAGLTNNFAGRTNPLINHNLTTLMVNPFAKFRGLEVFGLYERATGQNAAEYNGDLESRTWDQFAVDAVFRFLPREQLFVGARYNQANGQLVNSRTDVSIDRVQAGIGWFITPNVLTKLEYVSQRYHDFPDTDIRTGGRFNGFMIEGVVAF